MKKIIALLICSIIVALNVNPVLAASNDSIISKTTMGILINGERIRCEVQPVVKNGRVLVPSKTISEGLNAKVEWSQESNTAKITKGSIIIDMKAGDKNTKVNNASVTADTEPLLLNGTLMVPLRFISESFKYTLNWDGANNVVNVITNEKNPGVSRGGERKPYVVVIDAGHGGSETGAIHGGVKEKDLNLDIAKKLEVLLKAQGIKTYMTRTNDSYVGLYARSGLANKVKADLLISVHNNAETNTKRAGSMSLYNPGANNSNGNLSAREFAAIVQKELTGKLKTANMGVIQRPNLAVLRTANMPAVIAEVGYMTNSAELKKLKSEQFKQQAADALKRSVVAALNEIY